MSRWKKHGAIIVARGEHAMRIYKTAAAGLNFSIIGSIILLFHGCDGGKFEAISGHKSIAISSNSKNEDLLISEGSGCLSEKKLESFRKCILETAKKIPVSDSRAQCSAGFRSQSSAQMFRSSLENKEQIAVFPFEEGSLCAIRFPQGYFLQTRAEFESRQETQFSLPHSYADVKTGIKNAIASHSQALKKSINSKARDKKACPVSGSNEMMLNWNEPRDWAYLGYLAEALRSGSMITKNDPWDLTLSDESRKAFLAIADHIASNANATFFAGISYHDPYDGNKLKNPIGWNNLASSWDAWRNGTCSSAASPNLWASGWALYILAAAYKESGNKSYLAAFYRGAIYWHALATPYNLLNDLSAARALFSKYGPYSISALYTVGGSRFSNGATDPQLLPVRYHYYFEDPARFALNDSAIMGMAMATAGLASPSSSFYIANGTGGSLPRTFLNIGLSTMKNVSANVSAGNYGYVDMDSLGYSSNYFEGHFDFTAYYVARVGGITKNPDMVAVAKKAILSLLNTPNTLSIYGVCLHRSLDPSILSRCKEILSTKYPNTIKSSPFILFASTALLDR